VSQLERLGWGPFFESQRRDLNRADLCFGRVVQEERGAYRVAGEFEGWVEVGGRFRHHAPSAGDFPAVGDWVGIRRPSLDVPTEGHRGVVDVRLGRRSTIARAATGRVAEPQVIAANVDTMFIVTAIERDFNPRRLERYLTLVWETGAVPIVIVNKADLSDMPETAVEALRSRLPLVEVVAVSALRGDGIEDLACHLAAAQTVALVGSSGVGKSTLLNRLAGRGLQRVSGLDHDGRGRHTTTSRQLIELPGGALVIDTPGMRELQPWDDGEAVTGTFDDIVTLASDCRFADCRHETEPGCAVRAAVERGGLDPDRLENYERMLRELAFERAKHDKAAAASAKRGLKRMMRAQKSLYRERGRS
jgi:ribosome biogenesis GTPase / thiamine phosphate phosphatase